MTRMIWGGVGDRVFETGVDRGVLYLANQPGVAWNGLVSVDESPSGGEAKPFYADGLKYLNVSTREEFEATIEAFSSPPEFAVCDGVAAVQNGLFVSQQPRRAFGFSYRTTIGNDTAGLNYGYKIHLVYNALAAPSERTNTTLTDSPEAVTMSWGITTLPPSLTGYKPTSHLTIDSRKTPRGLLAAIENILYGSDVADARLPMPSELFEMFFSIGPLMRTNILDNPSFRAGSSYVEVIRNYIKNPSFRGLSSTTEVRRNLITNPQFKVGTSSMEIRRNLVQNPAFKTANGGIEVRRNLCVNPNPATTNGYNGLGATSVPAPWDATRYAVSSTANGAGTYYIFSAAANTAPIVSGTTITVSGTIQVPAGKYYRTYVHVRTGNYYYSSATAPFVLSDGRPVRVSKTEVLTSDAPDVDLAILVYDTNTGVVLSSGTTCYMGDVLIENADVAMPYFDGSTVNADGLVYSWTGVATTSPSIATGTAVKTYALSPGVVAWRGADNASLRLLRKLGSTGWCEILSGNAPLTNVADVLTYSADISSDSAASFSMGYIAAATPTVPAVDGTATAVGTASQRMSVTTAPGPTGVTSTRVKFFPRTNGIAFTIRNLLGEAVAVSRPYFDGSSIAGNGLTYSWAGTVNDSASIATGFRPTDVNGASDIYVNGAGKMIIGSRSTTLTPSTNDTYAYVVGDTGGFRLGMLAGKTYTLSGEGYATGADANERASGMARSLTIWYRDAAGSYKFVASPAVPVDTVPTRVSVTVAIPSDATEAFVRLYNGSAWGVRDVIWNKVMLEESTVVAPYFDGATPAAGDLTYAWVGAANASASVVTGKNVINLSSGGNVSSIQSTEWTRPGRPFSLRIASQYFNDSSGYIDVATLVGGAVNLIKGNTYTIGAWFYSPTTNPNDKAGFMFVLTGVSGNQSAIVKPGGGEQYLSLTFTVPTDPNMTGAYIRIYNNLAKNKADVWLSDLILVDGTTLPPFFDGTSLPADGLTYSWTGTADASASIASGTKVDNWLGSNGTLTRGPILDPQWYADLRRSSVYYSQKMSTAAEGDLVSGKITLQAILGETLPGATVQVRIHDGVGYVSSPESVVLPLDGTPIVVDTKAISPVVGSTPSVRMYIYANGNSVRVSNAIVEKVANIGDSAGWFFDGSSVDANLYYYDWVGTPDASPSVVHTWN